MSGGDGVLPTAAAGNLQVFVDLAGCGGFGGGGGFAFGESTSAFGGGGVFAFGGRRRYLNKK